MNDIIYVQKTDVEKCSILCDAQINMMQVATDLPNDMEIHLTTY